MTDSAYPDSTLKTLGFWFSVLGIMLSVIAATRSGDQEYRRAEQQIHWMHPFSANATGSGLPERIAMQATKELMVKVFVPVETVSPLPVPPLDEKAQAASAPPKSSVTVRGKQAENLYRPIILRVAHRHQIDPAMVKAIIMAESSFNPKAISSRGAVGLMQLMPNTAKSLGVVDAFDPENNINAGVLYFKRLLKEFRGDVKLALAAYNAGSRKVREYQGIPPFKTTQTYIKKVFEYYQHYKNESLHPDDRA